MRPSCLDCARKHLAQAMILTNEARMGYPIHFWYAVGHLAEASDELLAVFPKEAEDIREERLKYQKSPEYSIPYDKLIKHLTSLEHVLTEEEEEQRTQDRLAACHKCGSFNPANLSCLLRPELLMSVAVTQPKNHCLLGLWKS